MMALSKVIALLMIVTCVCGYYGSRFSKREPSDRLCSRLREAYENIVLNNSTCKYGSYYMDTCKTYQCLKGPSETCYTKNGYGLCGSNLVCCEEICRGCFNLENCDKSAVCSHYNNLAEAKRNNKLPQQLIQKQFQQQQQQKEQQLKQQFKQLLQKLFFTTKEISPELIEPESTEIDNYHYY